MCPIAVDLTHKLSLIAMLFLHWCSYWKHQLLPSIAIRDWGCLYCGFRITKSPRDDNTVCLWVSLHLYLQSGSKHIAEKPSQKSGSCRLTPMDLVCASWRLVKSKDDGKMKTQTQFKELLFHTLPSVRPMRYSLAWRSTPADSSGGGLARALTRAWCNAGINWFRRGITVAPEVNGCEASRGEEAHLDATGRNRKITSIFKSSG